MPRKPHGGSKTIPAGTEIHVRWKEERPVKAEFSNSLRVSRVGNYLQFDFGQVSIAELTESFERLYLDANADVPPVTAQNVGRFVLTTEAFLSAWEALSSVHKAMDSE